MSVFGAIYTGLSGLISFSKGLNVISNNVTNLNTPGFRGSDLIFRDLLYQKGLTVGGRDGATQQIGKGVVTGATRVRTIQGDLQETRNETDAAISGSGFFVLRGDSDLALTRVGQFEFDEGGRLIDTATGRRVAGFDDSLNLVDIDISSFRTNPPSATANITFENNLSTGSTDHTIPNIAAFDATGRQRTLEIKFTNNGSVVPRSWLIEVRDETGTLIDSGQEIRFQSNGSPEVTFNFIDFILALDDGQLSTVRIDMGEPGQFSASTSFSTGATSNLAVRSQDGFGLGALVGLTIAADGQITADYTNAQIAEIGTLALATTRDAAQLRQLNEALFTVPSLELLDFGNPNSPGFGSILGGNIEVSNVELSEEFADLIIVQRGFQSSSQVVSAANEMIQQLLDIEQQ